MTGSVIEAVIFDWGGTLTPWHTIEARGPWAAYTAAAGLPDAATDALLAAENELWVRVREHHTSFTLAQVLANADVEHPDVEHHDADLEGQALAALRQWWQPHTVTDPAARAMLEGLRADGLATGVLSSTSWPSRWHHEVFARDGVDHLIDAVVLSSDLAVTKPHPDAFRAAAAAVGSNPRCCVYVGDRLFDDVHGAAAVGMRTIFLPHSEIPLHQQVAVDVVPDAVIGGLGEVRALVAAWRAGSTTGSRG